MSTLFWLVTWSMILKLWQIVSQHKLLCSFTIFSCKEHDQSDFIVDPLVMSICGVVSWGVGKWCLLLPLCSLDKILLAFALLHFLLQGQTRLLFQMSPDFLLLHSNPLWWKGPLFLLDGLLLTYLNIEVTYILSTVISQTCIMSSAPNSSVC